MQNTCLIEGFANHVSDKTHICIKIFWFLTRIYKELSKLNKKTDSAPNKIVKTSEQTLHQRRHIQMIST